MPGYISEIDYYGNASADFIEIAVPKGTDVSGYTVVVYKSNGNVSNTLTFDASTQTVDQKDVYLLDSTDSGWKDVKKDMAVALVDDLGNVLQFVSFEGNTVTGNQGPANGLTSTSIGTITAAGDSLETTDGGSSYSVQTAANPGTIPCYAAGTRIATASGLRPVEALKPGDMVLTLDHGPQQVIWVRRRRVELHGEPDNDRVPVLIKSGALGPGRPLVDLVVSPQHRVLVGGHGQLEDRCPGERLVPAKALAGLPGVRRMNGKRSVDYVHILCERHELVVAEGLYAETLLLGRMVLQGLTRLQQQGMSRAFSREHAGGEALNGPPVRPLLPVRQALSTLRAVYSRDAVLIE